jgi:hypothetical protein
MTKDEELAMDLALEALEAHADIGIKSDKAITAIKQARSAPVQSLPFGVGGGLVAIKTLLSRDPCVHANTAIEMLDAILKEHPAAQPAPVQEPVADAWMHKDGRLTDAKAKTARVENFHGWRPLAFITSATPPAAQRQWVGLTDEEENALIPDPDGSAEANVRRVEVLPGAWGKEYEEVDAWSKPLVLQMLRDHEAKLKEKNNG